MGKHDVWKKENLLATEGWRAAIQAKEAQIQANELEQKQVRLQLQNLKLRNDKSVLEKDLAAGLPFPAGRGAPSARRRLGWKPSDDIPRRREGFHHSINRVTRKSEM